MKILIVEDDGIQATWALRSISGELAGVEVKTISTEYAFRCEFESIAADCPQIVIMDVMLRWTDPQPNMATPPAEVIREGPFRAGLRCARMLTQDRRTRGCFILLYSVLDRNDITGDLRGMGRNVLFLQKGIDSDALSRTVRFLLDLPPRADLGNAKVFVVHGRDTEARETVARFLQQLRLDPILLFEQLAAGGTTVIEKLEQHADVACAVVLLTPDDIGGLRGHDAKGRARQNVIFELGYFVGKIGRANVYALYKDETELPSDYHGVLYIRLDPDGAWRLELARQLRGAGLPIDLNAIM